MFGHTRIIHIFGNCAIFIFIVVYTYSLNYLFVIKQDTFKMLSAIDVFYINQKLMVFFRLWNEFEYRITIKKSILLRCREYKECKKDVRKICY